MLIGVAVLLLGGGFALSRGTSGAHDPAGEVTLVFAALGSTRRVGQTPLLDERGYTALVTVVIVTTLLTPPALKWSLGAKIGSHGVTRPAA